MVATDAAAAESGVHGDPAIRDPDFGPHMIRKAAEMFGVDQAESDAGGDFARPAEGGEQDGVLRAVAGLGAGDFRRGGEGAAEVLVSDRFVHEFFERTGNLPGVLFLSRDGTGELDDFGIVALDIGGGKQIMGRWPECFGRELLGNIGTDGGDGEPGGVGVYRFQLLAQIVSEGFGGIPFLQPGDIDGAAGEGEVGGNF